MPLPNYSSQSVRATAPGRGAAPRVPTATFRGDVMNMGQGAPTQRLNIPQIDPATGRPSTFGLQPFPTGGISKMVPGVTYAPATQFNANDPNSPELQNRSSLFQAVLGQPDPSAGVPQTTIFPGSEGNPVAVNAGSAMGAPIPANPGIAAGPGVVQTQSFGQTGFPAMQQQAQAGQPPLPVPTAGPQQDLFGGTMFPGVLGSTGAGMQTQPAGNPLSPVPAGGTPNLFGNSQTGVAAPNVFPTLYPRTRKAPPLYSQS